MAAELVVLAVVVALVVVVAVTGELAVVADRRLGGSGRRARGRAVITELVVLAVMELWWRWSAGGPDDRRARRARGGG